MGETSKGCSSGFGMVFGCLLAVVAIGVIVPLVMFGGCTAALVGIGLVAEDIEPPNGLGTATVPGTFAMPDYGPAPATATAPETTTP